MVSSFRPYSINQPYLLLQAPRDWLVWTGHMVDTKLIIAMTYVCGGGHAVARAVQNVAPKRICEFGSS